MATAETAYNNDISPAQSYLANADWQYPEKDNIAIFGPVLLPKVYGSNLSELEIASDGMISLTINSVKAITVDEVGNNYVVQAEQKPLELTSTENEVVVLSETIKDEADLTTHDTTMTKGFQFKKKCWLLQQSLRGWWTLSSRQY